MADIRMLVSWGAVTAKPEDRYSNTLYFAVDGLPSDEQIQDLADDLRDIYLARSFCAGCRVEVRAYNMADAKPRPERGFAFGTAALTAKDGPGQVALCLSYYSERNLPRNRGRIYCGPYPTPGVRPQATHQDELSTHAQALSGLGGVNVDWSVWSPTTAAEGGDGSKSISNYWIDNSWDIQRRRKIDGTSRVTGTVPE